MFENLSELHLDNSYKSCSPITSKFSVDSELYWKYKHFAIYIYLFVFIIFLKSHFLFFWGTPGVTRLTPQYFLNIFGQ